jgi:large conductance mechanosensitive channel
MASCAPDPSGNYVGSPRPRRREGSTLKDFRQFLLRGNVVDLAVGIVIGVAFGVVVTAFVGAFITPLIALISGKADVSKLAFTVGSNPGTVFPYGQFLNALISFVLVALAVFFLVVRPINALVSRSRKEPAPDPTTRKCQECLSEIPIDARRCAFCASQQPAAA